MGVPVRCLSSVTKKFMFTRSRNHVYSSWGVVLYRDCSDSACLSDLLNKISSFSFSKRKQLEHQQQCEASNYRRSGNFHYKFLWFA